MHRISERTQALEDIYVAIESTTYLYILSPLQAEEQADVLDEHIQDLLILGKLGIKGPCLYWAFLALLLTLHTVPRRKL